MGQAPKLCSLLGPVLILAGCTAAGPLGGQDAAPLPTARAALAPPVAPASAATVDLPVVPGALPSDRPLPINLPTALELGHARAVDVAAATAKIQVAVALLEQAQAQWLPTITMGGDYFGHTGPIQDVSTAAFNNSRNSVMLGAGVGIGPAAVFTFTDAIFAPLAARQHVRAGEANRQAAVNDTLVAVTDAYFTVQQARGELAAAIETTRLTKELVARTTQLAPGVVPDLELFRAKAELARRKEADLLARERWKVASAELLRVLRLDAAAQVEPIEPPQLRIELIDPGRTVDDLIPVALTSRPELASQQAQVQATLALLQQERWRPLLPTVVVRGASTPGGTLAGGVFQPSPNSSISGWRADVDVQVLWQLNNLGWGNVALVHQREAEKQAATVELARIEDRIQAEVAQAHAQAQLAAERVEAAAEGLGFAQQSANKNLVALGQTKGVGAQLVTLVRPQEVVAAIQALSQAYVDYFGAIADANRAQFRLYRALGQPADFVTLEEQKPPRPKLGVPVEAPR